MAEICTIRDRFLKDQRKWLKQEIYTTDTFVSYTESNRAQNSHIPKANRGRPQLPFQESSIKTKKKRVEKLVKNYTMEELFFATQQSSRLRSSGSEGKSKILSSEQALALYLDLNLTEQKYNLFRSAVNNLHPNCFLRIAIIRKHINQLIPRNIDVTEGGAEVNLQELLNITVESILKTVYLTVNH
ncbi:unnamed protein product [Psylliodes chrysocephalus]|uniref:Uncharacterized protein n=1 Tax=Psylliodes chrysocephalus TaxID=3402493 RepID=A0A9P0C8Y6_9CUCU|nr:unnamed protein product [Psylliodes chrysocephala]